jgi:hypothetical protein
MEFNSNTRYKVVNEREETKLAMNKFNKFNKFNLPSSNVAYNISFNILYEVMFLLIKIIRCEYRIQNIAKVSTPNTTTE